MFFTNNTFPSQEQLLEINELISFKDNRVIEVVAKKGKYNSFNLENNTLTISYLNKSYVFKALSDSLVLNSSKNDLPFDDMGIMLDCSRNGIYTNESIKKLIKYLAMCGYTSLQLYTEDTYEIDGEPYFGYLRGSYSKEDLKELNSYADSYGIELIPCIQTLAHLSRIFRWKPYENLSDTDDILLVGNEKVYELIEKMFKTTRECFTTDKINIGMDEAFLLGSGKYREANGDVCKTDIMKQHVDKVLSIAKEYNYKCSMWSDMYYRLAFGSYYDDTIASFPSKVKSTIPEDVSLIYWDYYSKSQDHFEKILIQHNSLCKSTVFAGGFWSFIGMIPNNNFSIESAKASLEACKNNGIKNIFFAIWGDNGSECPLFSLLPSIFKVSDLAYNQKDEKTSIEKFNKIIGVDFNDFLLLDKINEFGNPNKLDLIDPSKYLLFNDCFAGIYDSTIEANDISIYCELLASFKKIKPANYCQIFNYGKAMCDVLQYKVSLGINTRKYYNNNDKKSLLKLANKEYKILIKKLTKLHKAFKEVWFSEKKGNGFEIIDYRIGGLVMRIKDCRAQIIDYCRGKTSKIDELELTILDFYGNGNDYKKQSGYFNDFTKMATVNYF